MRAAKTLTVISLGVVVVTSVFVVSALAGGGWHHGRGHHMMGGGSGYGGGYGYGGGPGYCGGHGYGWGPSPWANLTPEQNEKMDDLRKKYWEETRSQRQGIFSKKQELWRLYSEEKPDQDKISKLEREIFDLQQELREKHFVFKQEARKIAPGYKGGYGYGRCGRHMGPGWGGHMMGPGWCGYHRGRGWGGHMMGYHGGCPWRGAY